MKQIINGKKYDTETAENVGEYWNGCSTRDFNYCEEILYKKRTGEFFLHGCGGPMSKYTRAYGSNSWGGDERLIPMSLDEAKEWAEQHLDGDEYEKIFGEVEE